MKAKLLGSTPLTMLIRCACGQKNYFDRAEWQRRVFLRCDKCFSCICYYDLAVNVAQGDTSMVDFNFKETSERRAIVEGLQKLERDAVAVADLMKAQGLSERAHKLLNIAQAASSQKSLIALDWRDEDALAA